MTKNGKIIARRPGQNHFNAKERRSKQLAGKRSQLLHFSPKAISRFITKK